MNVRAPEVRRELKDRYLCKTCAQCSAQNHIVVTYDVPRNHSLEIGLCWRCHAPVHEEVCFMIWTGETQAIVERHAGHAARLRRAL